MIDLKKTRVILHPGFITSQTDGDMHYVSGSMLRELYDVPQDMFVIIIEDEVDSKGLKNDAVTDIHLYPNDEGQYNSLRLHVKGANNVD